MFSHLDCEIKRAPQRSVLGASGVTNLHHNKTLEFLNKLAMDTKKKYFCIARKLGQRRKNDAFETSKVVRQQHVALQVWRNRGFPTLGYMLFKVLLSSILARHASLFDLRLDRGNFHTY